MHEFKFDLPKEEILTVPATFCEDDAGFSANFESGLDGASAYQIAVEHGFEGTEEEWLESLRGEPGKDGAPGQPGKDGYSPVKGIDYFDGKDGKDGYTPVKGIDYFDGNDGQPGKDGAPGKDGQPGKDGIDGADGYSPSVAVSDIDGGHRVTITDKDGEKAFDVMDGKDGESTEGGGGVGQFYNGGTGEIFNDYAKNKASGKYSHAEGSETKALGAYSHVEGCFTIADSKYAHVQGKYNELDAKNKYAHIVGNGTDGNARSNAHTVDWEGMGWFARGVMVGGTSQDHYAANPVLTAGEQELTVIQKDQIRKNIGADVIPWINVKDKPFVQEKVIVNEPLNLTWDGNTVGLLCVKKSLYKVSDDVFSDEDIKKMTIDWGSLDPDGWRNVEKFDQYWDSIVDMGAATEDWVTFHNELCVFFIRKAKTTVDWCGIEFPEPGVYFYFDSYSRTYSLTSEEPVAQTKTVEHIDVNYLPEALQIGEERVETVEPLNIQWDGNTKGRTVVQSLVAPELVWAKVSDEVFTDEQIKVMDYAFGALDDDNTAPTAETWETTVNTGSVTNDFVVVQSFGDPLIVFIRKAGVTFGGEADILSGATFPEVGVYFFRPDQFVFAKYLGGNIPYTKTIVHTVEPKYLPMSDITAAVLSALPTETWTFTMEDGTEITKGVVIA